ncbi:MAG: hypothetical protein ACRDTH_02980 [Pseudonocardiaceae bacterium]
MSHQAAFLRLPALATDLARAAKDNGKRAGCQRWSRSRLSWKPTDLPWRMTRRGAWPPFASLNRPSRLRRVGDRPEWLAYFDGAYLAAKFGRCFRDLGRSAEAERFARRSLDMIDGYDRGRLFNLALLASTLADQRKVEEACETGLAALRIASDVRSARTDADLADLSQRLTPFQAEPAVQSLNEQIRVLVQRSGEA